MRLLTAVSTNAVVAILVVVLPADCVLVVGLPANATSLAMEAETTEPVVGTLISVCVKVITSTIALLVGAVSKVKVVPDTE
jgi:hypothetical protein